MKKNQLGLIELLLHNNLDKPVKYVFEDYQFKRKGKNEKVSPMILIMNSPQDEILAPRITITNDNKPLF